jgi:ADP-ribosylglycohydrolase
MLGAIAGDVIGSSYEHAAIKHKTFKPFTRHSTFTDDTVLSTAVAYAILEEQEYGITLKSFGRRYPDAGYGAFFMKWLLSSSMEPYGSWGNGAAMRVSPVGFAFDTEDKVLQQAEKSASVTHNHPDAIKGAQATALAVFMARHGESKKTIQDELSRRFAYDLDRHPDDIRPDYRYHSSCGRSVPESLICFLASSDYEDAVRTAVSLGGDADTMACIAGAVSQAYYKSVPPEWIKEVRNRLPRRLLSIVDRFCDVFSCGAQN